MLAALLHAFCMMHVVLMAVVVVADNAQINPINESAETDIVCGRTITTEITPVTFAVPGGDHRASIQQTRTVRSKRRPLVIAGKKGYGR